MEILYLTQVLEGYSNDKKKALNERLFEIIISNYRDSVKVRAITSRCCSVVSELKRTA